MPDLRLAAYVFVWVLCLGAAGGRLYDARHEYDDPAKAADEWKRPAGNSGYTHIDFGGQWVMGRMVARGHTREMYDRNRLWQVARAGYPLSAEPPAVRDESFPAHLAPRDTHDELPKHDADALMNWFMGSDSTRWPEAGAVLAVPFAAGDPLGAAALMATSAELTTPELVADVSAKQVGGPLYPPLQGFLYAPLCRDDEPATAYARFQWLSVALTFLAGWAAAVVTGGRVWWPAATLFLLLYPGYRSGLVLGQNHIVTLTILLGGWALLVRGKDTAGGMVWGLLAFKPVWGLAFVLAPLLMRRWRFCAAMAGTGLGLVAATLPFTGVQVWLDWLKVGNDAAELYKVNKNWVELSRDLHGIPRRILLDFTAPEADRGHPWAGPLGWMLWGAVFVGTIGVYAWRGRRNQPTGLAAGFLFLGAYLCCYRFMYYDVLLSAVAVVVLWADPGRLVRFATWQYRWMPFGPRWVGYATAGPILLVLMLLIGENVVHHLQPHFAGEVRGWHLPATGDPPTPRTPKLEFGVGYYHPWETVLVLGLWGWCGWRLAWAGHGSDDV